MTVGVGPGILFLVVAVVMLLWAAIKILPEYERGVVFFLGRYQTVKGPGLVIIIPGLQRMVRVSLRTITMDVPPQEVITKDNVSVRVNAVVYFRVIVPEKAIIMVENYLYATSQLAQTTLRSVCGQAELDELLAEREKLNKKLQEILDRQTDPWGVKVTVVEIKAIDLPEEMKRAMAKQAEAEREKRAKIIHADGEFSASQRIFEAANVLSRNPVSLQLRYLQTLTEIAAEQNSTTIFPVPMDLIRPFLEFKAATDGGGGGEAREKTPPERTA
ncbi:MAG TPA: slipin family protein [Deltaproteobacteria bacterium]|nr:slipin family protein [Deltaproteobacteria bacterium]